jgi:hypothetical protein
MIADNIPGYQSGRAKNFFSQDKISQILKDTGVTDDQRLRIPLPIKSPSYSVSGIMAPGGVNRSEIGMTKEYLSSPMGRAALDASIQAELEGLGISAERASEVLDLVGPELNTAVDEFDNTIEGWKSASTKAIKQIESSSRLTNIEKSAIRKRIAPINPQDYTVASDSVLEIKKGSDGKRGKGTPRSERKDSAYKAERQKQILKQRGYATDDLVFAHMPGYEKIEGTQRATMRPPTAAGKVLTGAQLAAAEKLRKDYLINQGISVQEIEKIATEDANVYQKAINKAAGVESPSRKTRKTGEDIGRGLEEGMKSRQDDVALVGSKLGQTATNGVQGGARNIPFRAPGQPGYVASNVPKSAGIPLSETVAKARVNRENLINLQQQKQSQLLTASTQKLGNLNNKIMGSTFALTSLAGIASMAGGNLGKLSEVIFKISGVAFAFSSILQILPKSLIGFISKFKFAFGGAALALTAGIAIIKLVNAARERERKQLEAFGDAVKNTKEQIQGLGDYFGIIPTKTGLETTKPQLIVDKNTREALDKFKASDTFKEFASTIEAVSKLSDNDAMTALKTKGQELLGKGFTKDQVSLILRAIQEEAGRTTLKVDFKNIDINVLNTELQNEITTKLSALPKFINENLERKMVLNESGRWVSQLVPGKKIEAELKNSGALLKTFFNGLSGMFKNGVITGKEFNASFAKTMDTLITQIPNARQQTLLLNAALNQMESELAKNAIQINDVKDKILLLQAAAVNATVSMAALGALRIAADDPKDVDAQIRAAAVRSDVAKAILDATKLQEIANKGLNDSFKNLNKTEEKRPKTQLDVLKQAQDFIALQEQLIDMQNASKLKAYNDELERQEELLKNINKEIDKITETSITPIEAKIKSNSYLIDQIAIKEEEINEQYNLQIQALNKVRDINQEINASEKERLTLADALTRGDISAAASIAQDARARQAAFINERMETSLATSRDSRISLLGRNTLEKENKQLQLDIAKIQKEQLDGLGLQKDAIQKNINAQNELRSNLEKQIQTTKEGITYLGLTKAQIDESVKALDLAQNENINLKSDSFLGNVLKGALGDANALLAALRDVAKASKDAFSTSTARGVVASSLGIPEQVSPKLLESIVSGAKPNDVGEEVRLKLLAESKKTGSDPFGAGAASSGRYTAQAVAYYQNQINQAMAKATGGMVPKYYVSGGYSKGTDTIPAMLTPGEFVVRKNAVDSFGVNNLNKINDGSYGGSSVYNYSLNVNVKSDSSPDDIARTVMTQIKRIDNQRIKTQRGA